MSKELQSSTSIYKNIISLNGAQLQVINWNMLLKQPYVKEPRLIFQVPSHINMPKYHNFCDKNQVSRKKKKEKFILAIVRVKVKLSHYVTNTMYFITSYNDNNAYLINMHSLK